MDKKRIGESKIFLILGALSLAASFNYPSLWFLGFFSLVPLLNFIYQNKRSGKNFLCAYIFGTIYAGGTILWYWDTLPLDWAGINGKFLGVALVFAIWFLSSLVLGLFIALWAAAFGKMKRGGLSDFFIAPFLWIIFEYLRSAAFSVFWAGPGSLFGAHWSFGFLGYIPTESGIFLPLAGIGGVYLLGFFVVFANVFVSKIIAGRTRGLVSVFVAAAVFLIIAALATPRAGSGTEKYMKTAILRTNAPARFESSEKAYSEKLKSVGSLVLGIGESGQNPDIIIFPEDSRFVSAIKNSGKAWFLRYILGGKEILIIDSAPKKDKAGGGKNSAEISFFNTKSEQTQTSDKMLLVPHGEYMPYVTAFGARIFGRGEWVKNFEKERGYAGGEKMAPAEFKGAKIGTLFCSEIVSPFLYGDLTRGGAEILVNIASHSVFHGSRLLYSQTLKMAKVRAVENNRYFVEATNFNQSFVIDNAGRMVKESRGDGDSVIYANIPLISRPSVYNSILDFLGK